MFAVRLVGERVAGEGGRVSGTGREEKGEGWMGRGWVEGMCAGQSDKAAKVVAGDGKAWLWVGAKIVMTKLTSTLHQRKSLISLVPGLVPLEVGQIDCQNT